MKIAHVDFLRSTVFLAIVYGGIWGEAAATQVVFKTSLGNVRVNLFDDAAPITVANFLQYVDDGDYQHSIIHRSVPNFVIQGGGYKSDFSPIPTDPPIINESALPNLRGTLSMATAGGNPNSATSQWFVNLVNNSPLLDEQNGGFTVFGEIVLLDMVIVDAIAALPIINAGGAFAQLPLVTPFSPGDGFEDLKPVVVNDIVRVPEPSALGLGLAWMLAISCFRSAKRK